MKHSACWPALAAGLLIAGSTAAETPLRIKRAEVLASDGRVVNRNVILGPLQKAPGLAFRQTVDEPGSKSVRLRFKVRTPGSNWAVKVLGRDARPAWWVSSGEVAGDRFWSADVAGSQATIEVYSTIADNPLVLVIDGVAVARDPVKPASLTIPDERAPIGTQSAQIRGWGRSVVRLRFVGDDGERYFCSGLLVSRDLLLTNDHCMQSEDETQSALVDFDYDAGTSPESGALLKEKLVADAALDYALYRLAQDSGRSPLRLRASTPPQDQALLLLQHPGGEAKQVSLRGCTVKVAQVEGASATRTDFGHLCDTLGGSSGSPVMDPASGDVIGLHHFGFREGAADPFNQAVQIGLILDHLHMARPDVFPEIGTGQ